MLHIVKFEDQNLPPWRNIYKYIDVPSEEALLPQPKSRRPWTKSCYIMYFFAQHPKNEKNSTVFASVYEVAKEDFSPTSNQV